MSNQKENLTLFKIKEELCQQYGKIFAESKDSSKKIVTNEPIKQNHPEQDAFNLLNKIQTKALNQILIEFFTINLFLSIRSKLKSLFIKELARLHSLFGLKRKMLAKNYDLIEKKIKNEFKLEVNVNLFEKANQLKAKFVDYYQQRVQTVFGEQDKIKFRLQIVTNHARDESNSRIEKFNKISRFFLKNNFICKIFCPNLFYRIDYLKPNSLFKSLTTDGTLSNNLVKSLTGILASIFLSMLIYFYLRYQTRSEANRAAFYMIAFFLVLIYGLTLNKNRKFRALVLLMIPFMASNRARAILIVNCCIITATYVLPNIIQNLEQLQYSYSCNLDLYGDQIEEHAGKSSTALRFKKTARKMRQQANTMANKLRKVQTKMLKYSRQVKSFLESVGAMCSNEAGYLERKCKKVMAREAKVPMFQFMLAWAGVKIIYTHVCPILNGPQATCVGARKAVSKLVKIGKRKGLETMEDFENYVNKTTQNLKKQFDFKIKSKNKQKVKFTQDKKYKDIMVDLVLVYKKRFEKWSFLFEKFEIVFLPSSFVLILLCAMFYLKRYLSCDFYDNYVIGAKFHELNVNRQKCGKQSLLPLKEYLRFYYADLYDLRMSTIEFKQTYKSFFTLCLTLMPIYLVLGLDSLLIHLTIYMRENTAFEYDYNDASERDTLNVKGNNFIGMYL